MDDKKIVFALDIGTRSVVGIVGALTDGCFNVLDYEQEFHEKRAMRDGQIEDIDLVARVVNSVKAKLQQRTGQTFTRVSIAAAGRALKTVPASFTYDLISNQPITDKLVQYMEYSAIEIAQKSFTDETANSELEGKNYYCVGYSVTDYYLDDYKIKNLEGQKGNKAITNIIAAFLPASVLISLYAVTARCGLDVDNLTLEPIAAIHAVVPDDVRFLNIALIDIGGGTSDIAISRDGSVIAYDMVTIAGDEITESVMKTYLTNFATAERIKLAMNGEEQIDFKDILGNTVTLTPDEAFTSVRDTVNSLAESISQRILLINGTAPAAVFLVGGGSQIRDLCKIVAEKLGMPHNRVAIGVANTDTNLSLFSENLYNPTFVTPIGIGIVSSLYRGCDFFAISVNGKRVMLFNHQAIKVIDALMLSGIKPSSLIGLTAPNLIYTLNGQKQTIKGALGIPGELMVNGVAANIETEIKQGDEITVTPAQNGEVPHLTLKQVLSEFERHNIVSLKVNDIAVNFYDDALLHNREVNYMDNIMVILDENKDPDTSASECVDSVPLRFSEDSQELPDTHKVEISKIYSQEIQQNKVSLLLADENDDANSSLETASGDHVNEVPDDCGTEEPQFQGIDVTLNNTPLHLIQETEEPLILMHLLKYVDLDVTAPKGQLILQINGVDAKYADLLSDHDVVLIKWSGEI